MFSQHVVNSAPKVVTVVLAEYNGTTSIAGTVSNTSTGGQLMFNSLYLNSVPAAVAHLNFTASGLATSRAMVVAPGCGQMPQNSTDCLPCSPGYGAHNQVCVPCDAGYYSTGGEEQCKPCAYGWVAPNASASCSACSALSVPSADSSTCVCIAGAGNTTSVASDGTVTCSTCSANTYKDSGNFACTPCPPTGYSAPGATVCTCDVPVTGTIMIQSCALPLALSVTPSRGPRAGGQIITIIGNSFSAVSSVQLNNITVAAFTTVSSTELRVVSAAAYAAMYGPVVITSAVGTGQGAAYMYSPAPNINTVIPWNGRLAGNTTVTLLGSNLGADTGDTLQVYIGTLPVTVFTRASSSHIVLSTPASDTTGNNAVTFVSALNGNYTTVPAYTYNPSTLPCTTSWGVVVAHCTYALVC